MTFSVCSTLIRNGHSSSLAGSVSEIMLFQGKKYIIVKKNQKCVVICFVVLLIAGNCFRF